MEIYGRGDEVPTQLHPQGYKVVIEGTTAILRIRDLKELMIEYFFV